MIIVDGRQSEKQISSFENLEEILTDVMEAEQMSNRIITDVLVNNENFSEVYPHQAEDMSCENISSVEIRSVEANKMAVDMAGELEKVARMMSGGARSTAHLFRESRDSDALELLQDLLDVTRDFMALISHLKDRYLGGVDEEFLAKTENFSNLISEMSEVLENEDWILLADLLEFEFTPLCDELGTAGKTLHRQLESCVQ